MIKAVFIDIDGTLLDFEACVEESMRLGLIERGVEYKPEMLETFHSINDVFWRDLEQGKITFAELLERRWATVFEALEIDLNGPEFETYFRNRLHESAIPMEGSYKTLEYLSGKYRLLPQATDLMNSRLKDFAKLICSDILRKFLPPEKSARKNLLRIFSDTVSVKSKISNRKKVLCSEILLLPI